MCHIDCQSVGVALSVSGSSPPPAPFPPPVLLPLLPATCGQNVNPVGLVATLQGSEVCWIIRDLLNKTVISNVIPFQIFWEVQKTHSTAFSVAITAVNGRTKASTLPVTASLRAKHWRGCGLRRCRLSR